MHTLFAPPSDALIHALDALPQALDAVMPLKPAHRRTLPLAVAELSARLTVERGAPLPYWSAPRLTAAYLWYFLPWNILRLARLLRGLDLPAPTPTAPQGGDSPLPRILADVGSGPLTLPIALWLAKPEWHTLPLTVLCTDAAPHPLELGRRLFAAVAPESRWRIVTKRAPADTVRREIAALSGLPWLISMVNVCNELKGRAGEHVFQRLESLVTQTAALLTVPDASALFVEPGTRLGGKTITALRGAALGHSTGNDDNNDNDDTNENTHITNTSAPLLIPSGPCVHTMPCPLRGGRTWCHFSFSTDGAPAWLVKLAQEASLPKGDLSLAFVHLRRGGPNATVSAMTRARVLSAPFIAQGIAGQARYACTARGLVVLENAQQALQGALVDVVWPQNPRRDAKSGAWIVAWAYCE